VARIQRQRDWEELKALYEKNPRLKPFHIAAIVAR
jgi:hypothetical protein